MSSLTKKEEANLKRLLEGRAGHLDVTEPYPIVDRSDRVTNHRRDHNRWVLIPSLAAAVLVLAFGIYRVGSGASTSDITTPADPPGSVAESDGDLLVFVFPVERTQQVYESIETLGSRSSSASVRRGVTDLEFTTYWSGFPEVLDDFEGSGRFPASLRVEVDGGPDRNQLITEIGDIEGVVRVDSYPGCGQKHGLVNSNCSSARSKVRDFVLAFLLGTAILALLVKFGYIQIRLMVALIMIALSAALIEVAVRPVKSELVRARPAVEEIRTQYGSDLTCTDWYELESSTRAGVPFNYEPRFDAVDPQLVQEALEDGIDIYLWPIWVVPAMGLIIIMLGVAFLISTTGRTKWFVRIAIALTIVGCLSAVPIDFRTNNAVQCMAE